MAAKEAGHSFLARLGKTKLRPGGAEATNWLIEHAHITADTKVLEVACNMGTTSIMLAKKYGCSIKALDQSKSALEKAKANIKNNGVDNLIELVHGSATKLPFEDESFDVVINEAMLTMLPTPTKAKALAEYFRVLRPGGVLLTHDVCLYVDNDEQRQKVINDMHDAINVPAQPLTVDEWKNLLKDNGFDPVIKQGAMTLMSPEGMIKDEGLDRALEIVHNGLKPENRTQFEHMANFFFDNAKTLGYVACCSKKPA